MRQRADIQRPRLIRHLYDKLARERRTVSEFQEVADGIDEATSADLNQRSNRSGPGIGRTASLC